MALVKFLLYSEVSVLACALALTWTGLRLSGQPADPALLALIGSLTFGFYTLERNLTLPGISGSIFPEKSRWLQSHRTFNLLLLGLAAVAGLLSLPRLSLPSLASLLGFGLLALSYSIFKLPRKDAPPAGLKHSFLAKPFLMVLVWTYLTLILPLMETGLPQDKERAYWLVLLWGLWIFSNSILFDIRDIQLDARAGVRTLAARLGRILAHRLIYLLGALQLIVCLVFAQHFSAPLPAAAMAFCSLSFLGCNAFLHRKGQAGLGFYLIADLTLILPALVLGGSHWILTR